MSTNRPTRRKSQLGNLTPLNPNRPQTATATPKAPPTVRPEESTTAPRRTKTAYYATREENERIRAAFMAGRDKYGWRSFTEFQLRTMLERVVELERELNDGEPFDGVPAGEAQRGRPLD